MRSDLPRTSVGFHFNVCIPLLMLKGVGWQFIDSHDYRWHGLERPEDQCVFQYCISGQGELAYNGKVYPIGEGDAFIIKIPSEHCYYLPDYSTHWEVLYLEFDNQVLPLWMEILSINGPVVSMEVGSELYRFMWDLYEKSVRDQIQHVYEGAKYTSQFVMELMCFAYQNQLDKPLTSGIDQCKRFIESHYADCIGLNEMSEAVAMSKYHLTRSFERKFGVSPIQYLNEVRLETAAKLLLSTADNLEQIARQTGYSSGNYFLKVFKKHFGVSPTEYRKRGESHVVSRVRLT